MFITTINNIFHMFKISCYINVSFLCHIVEFYYRIHKRKQRKLTLISLHTTQIYNVGKLKRNYNLGEDDEFKLLKGIKKNFRNVMNLHITNKIEVHLF